MDKNNPNNINKDEILHSTGYARAAHGSRIGAGSTETFKQRQHTERNRVAIRAYAHSRIGMQRSGLTARPIAPDPVGGAPITTPGQRRAFVAQKPRQPHHFHEPLKRPDSKSV